MLFQDICFGKDFVCMCASVSLESRVCACVCVWCVCYNWFISDLFVERLGSDSETCLFVCVARLLSSYICLDGFACSL